MAFAQQVWDVPIIFAPMVYVLRRMKIVEIAFHVKTRGLDAELAVVVQSVKYV
jgi:hypothetical protein